MRELTLKELRDTHPLTTSVLVNALDSFISDVEFGELEPDCDCVDCLELDSYARAPECIRPKGDRQ